MSDGRSRRGRNEGRGPWREGEEWIYVEDPIRHVNETVGLTEQTVMGTNETEENVQQIEEQLGRERMLEVQAGTRAISSWSDYPMEQSTEEARERERTHSPRS
jgi:Mn-containing catalase